MDRSKSELEIYHMLHNIIHHHEVKVPTLKSERIHQMYYTGHFIAQQQWTELIECQKKSKDEVVTLYFPMYLQV
jgi:hypothetical protein